jgi:serine-type D-Ala-D-Ala carboxypeptidase (penicillin-binding protein 5/6)
VALQQDNRPSEGLLEFDARGFILSLLFIFIFAASFLAIQNVYPATYAYLYKYGDAEKDFSYANAQLVDIKIRRAERTQALALLAEYKKQRAVRTISNSNIASAAANHDRLIAADLASMRLHLYEDGEVVQSVDIVSKGKRGSRWETPAGLYNIQTKELNHFSSIGEVNMPHSMQFFGNFFIHGWPYYPSGKPVEEGYSGGCIRLGSNDARDVFAFAEYNTPIFVYDDKNAPVLPNIQIVDRNVPANISASSFLVADIGKSSIFLERNASNKQSIASITKLMTALVANETVHYGRILALSSSDKQGEGDFGPLSPGEKFSVGEALYPLLMESNNAVAHALARYYGTESFIEWMNNKARAIGMKNTTFADASGISADNTSTAEDIFRLARYLYNHQSYILGVTKTLSKEIYTADGRSYSFSNYNHFADDDLFIGGKTGFTRAAGETMVSLFDVQIKGASTTIAIVVLNSDDREMDTKTPREWFEKNAMIADRQLPRSATFYSASAISSFDWIQNNEGEISLRKIPNDRKYWTF